MTAGPKRTRQTYTRYQTLELEKVNLCVVEGYLVKVEIRNDL